MAATSWMRGHKSVINCIAANENLSSTVSTCGDDGTVRVWDAGVGRSVRCFDCFEKKAVEGVTWVTADIMHAAAGGCVYTIDTRASDNLLVVKTHGGCADLGRGDITSLSQGVAGCEDGSVTLLSPTANLTYTPHDNVVSGLSHIPTLNRVISVAMDCTLASTIIAPSTGEVSTEKIELPALELKGPRVINPPFPTALSTTITSSNEVETAVGVMDGTVWVFSSEFEPLNVWKPHEEVAVEDVAWREGRLWTAGKNGYVGLWEFPGDEEEEEEEDEEDDEDVKLITAVQCPETVCSIETVGWLGERQVFTGDVNGGFGLHTLPVLVK